MITLITHRYSNWRLFLVLNYSGPLRRPSAKRQEDRRFWEESENGIQELTGEIPGGSRWNQMVPTLRYWFSNFNRSINRMDRICIFFINSLFIKKQISRSSRDFTLENPQSLKLILDSGMWNSESETLPESSLGLSKYRMANYFRVKSFCLDSVHTNTTATTMSITVSKMHRATAELSRKRFRVLTDLNLSLQTLHSEVWNANAGRHWPVQL